MKNTGSILKIIYRRLREEFGPQHWWPAKTDFEVIIGAILTQNTAWLNVEKAISNLKKNKLLTPRAMKKVSRIKLANLIRPSGYYNQKTKKIKNFIHFLFRDYQGSLKKMFSGNFLDLREQLLEVNGIGPETADSILLYAGDKPIFVVDGYTRRILSRHNLIKSDASYAEIQDIFMDNLRSNAALFNEYHALFVRLGKQVCKTKPNCSICPLKDV
ncbi:endonuclease III domain-containing protein [Candidatus Omnitrophota bacterium]